MCTYISQLIPPYRVWVISTGGLRAFAFVQANNERTDCAISPGISLAATLNPSWSDTACADGRGRPQPTSTVAADQTPIAAESRNTTLFSKMRKHVDYSNESITITKLVYRIVRVRDGQVHNPWFYFVLPLKYLLKQIGCNGNLYTITY